MTKREKIIVGLMAAAALYGAYSFLFSGSSGNNRKLSGRQAQVPVNEFVTDLIKRILESDSTATDSLILARAADKWRKDPFLVVKKTATTAEAAEKLQQTISKEGLTGAFSYSGYMEMGKRKLAIINGMEYLQGDSLDQEGAVLKKISPGEVLISVGAMREVIVVPIDDIAR